MSDLSKKFRLARSAMQAGLIERDREIELVQTALVCQEHVCLVGPPGVAKSMLIDSFAKWIVDAQHFTALMSPTMEPDELYGPVKISGLKHDDWSRKTDLMLPTSHIAFLDEIWNASASVLHTVLKVLNERTFKNGDTVEKCPLMSALAASNRWPDGKESCAVFDRFLFRREVKPISTFRGRDRLLFGKVGIEFKPEVTVTIAECQQAYEEAMELDFSDDAKEGVNEILRVLVKEHGVVPGDRRQRKAMNACRATAWIEGSKEVLKEHLEILADVLWDVPVDQPKHVERVVNLIANPAMARVLGLQNEAYEQFQNVRVDDVASMGMAIRKVKGIITDLGMLAGAKADAAKQAVMAELKALQGKLIEANEKE